jgi:hypothetical protein
MADWGSNAFRSSMTKPMRHFAVMFAVANLAALAPPMADAAARHVRVAPLSVKHAGQYSAQRVCSAPPAHHASCEALRVVRDRSASRAARRAPGVSVLESRPVASAAPTPKSGLFGYTPEQFHIAYELPNISGPLQTIALVDAYNDPTAEEDLQAYDQEFGLPECTTANGCFRQYNEAGELNNPPFPATTKILNKALASANEELREEGEEADGWGVEISLDIETAHAICENCHIALFESSSTSFSDFEATERSATNAAKADTEISNSWGGAECFGSTAVCAPESSAFNKPEIPITVSAGDDGYLNWQRPEAEGQSLRFANFPASLPDVIAVGGTRLTLAEGTGQYKEETVWNGHGAGGGGCSVEFLAPTWQRESASQAGCGKDRAVADVSADADPFTGAVVRYSRAEECASEFPVEGESEGAPTEEMEELPGWCQIGGTSLAAPLIAGVYALAGGSHGIAYPAATLYENLIEQPASLHDVTAGSNAQCNAGFNPSTGVSNCSAEVEAAECGQRFVCLARTGYDGPTGVGTPHNVIAFIPGPGIKPAATALPATTAPQPGPVLPATKPVPASVSRLALTAKAISALAHPRPRFSSIAFSFLLSRNVPVKVMFFKRIRVHRKGRWQAMGSAFTVDALAGRNAAHLRGHGLLKHGLYEVTLLPSGGKPNSIKFSLG